jgi:SAM-dependent methyltransferase
MITYTITSENSTDHWPYFNVDNHNVLDLGCGRWYTKDTEELSPIFFGKKANTVIGVDSNPDDIIFYKNETLNNPKFTFIHEGINNVDQVKRLLKEYSITALKSDIEGGEFILLDLTEDDLKNVTQLAIEFHSEVLKEAFINKVVEWGFNIDVKANFAQTPDYMGVLFCSKSFKN